ncbi:protein piccolo isoform X2 [Paroedura picta]|uniref:protein piccolo isoform X2 n=1 Tax=Paroedura picta TaxID=143630 RepID=UPI004056AF76
MGNEASLEGEGAEGAADGGARGPASVAAGGVQEDLSRLSEEERKQIAAVMARTQQGPPGAEPPPMARHPPVDSSQQPRQASKSPDPRQPTLSKSRTVDTLKTEQRVPGRSPSATSLRQSQSRTDFKEDPKPSMMPSFLSDANPFGAVTSVVNKFNPFDLISESDPAQVGAAKNQKLAQKEQERPEQQKAPQKLPTQQSPKPMGPLQGAAPQKMGLSKQQQPPGVPKQAQPQGPSQPAGPRAEETKQQQGPPKTQPQQLESAKPVQQPSPAKPPTQQAGAAKASPQRLATAQPSTQAPASPKSGVQQGMPPGKTLIQQPGGPTKAAPQAAGPSKPPSQHPGGLAKPLPQLAHPTAPLSEQPGRPQPEGSLKLQPELGKTAQQHPTAPSQQASPPVESTPKKAFCPLCSTTELLTHPPDKANCNTCTRCQIVVCSLCGFNPNPHIVEIKEWLCLNCQMQRALGGDLAPVHGPGPQPSSPKQKIPATPSATKPPFQQQKPSLTKSPEPQKPPTQLKTPVAKVQPVESPPKSSQAKAPLMEDKQKQSGMQKPSGGAVPTVVASEPKQGAPGPQATSSQPKMMTPQRSESAKPLQHAAPADFKSSPQLSQQNPDPKTVSLPGPSLDVQAQRQAETVEMKESSKKIPPHVSPQPDAQRDLKGRQTPAGQKPAPSQPQAPSQQPQVKPEPPQHLSRTGGAITDAPKTQPTTPQESMTGKLFGFGASIFSQASNLISTGGQPGAQSPGPPSGSPSKQLLPPAQPPSQKDAQQAQPSPKASPAKRNIRPSMPEQPKVEGTPTVKETEGEKKTLPGKATKPQIAKAKPSVQEPSLPAAVCPLCKTALNVGSKEHSNYQKCTECKNVVCNLCGFNPMPHITGVQEWLCLNCQTQRALTGQLGDMGQLTPMLSKSSPKPSVSVPSQPKLTESSSQQKTTARPSQVIEKPKEVQEIKKEDPKLQQKKLSQDTSADKVQETVEKEHVTAQEKLEKTVSADKITQIVQGEDLKIQKLKLAKSPSADQIPKEELKLTIRPPADKISEVIPDDLTKISSTSNKIQKVISAKAPSSQKAQNGNQELKAAEPQSADQIQKDDTNLQQVKLPKAPPADIKKEETKIQQVKLAEPSPADKIVQQFQKEHLKHQEEKLTEVPSTSDFKRQAPTLKQAKLDKIPSADQIWKDESKLKHGKIVKTSSADQLRLDDPKLVQVKPVKMPVVGPVPSKSSTDPAQLARTVEDDTKSPSLQNIPQFPETKLELVTGEAEEKLETKLPEGTRKKEAIKKEDSAIEIPKALSEDQKSQKDISVTTPLAKPDHIEALKGKAETEDKSDTSSSQQQKSPQGLSDTGYSSDGISSSLGEIPSLITSDEKDMLKEPYKQETLSQESSPTSPSDLAKLESTVLSILEAQACSLAEEKSGKTQVLSDVYPEQTKDTHKTKPLPIAPDSCSSDDEDLMAPKIPGKNGGTPAEDGKQSISSQKKYKQMAGAMEDASTRRQRYDSVDDSSESENSPVPQRKRRTSIGSSSSDEYKLEDSPGSGDEEELIRKQILEMSADEDASGSEDDKFIRNQLKEISANESPIKEEVKCKKGTAGKHKRIMRKSSIGYEEDASRRHSWHDDDDDETFDESPELKYRETKSQDSEEITGGGLRRFKTIELNSTIANKYSEESEQPKRSLYFDEEPELEMESLTDSPEDRSRGEGSSSLHASSFTPGTSPTSVSSLDEDSDSSPSHKKMGGESKQHRKARHRTHGPLLPTIEDSSEEEELREEEELLKEQEKQRELEQQQRKSSSKKSKKDKEELRAQRRRERPKTPPSNLSPIEDASPTEELRQAAEMEELHRSSCSEYSPSIESDPETFEISPEKIIEVQKVYKLPTSVSLYSPTEEQPLEVVTENSGLKTLKSAEEVYEEMLHTSLKAQKFADVSEKDEIFEKEPLYGGMLIEDYIYESLVEDTYSATPEASLIAKQSENDEFCQQRDKEKKTKPLGQLDGGPIQTSIDVQKEYYSIESLHSVIAQEDIVCSSYIMPESHEIVVLDSEAPSSSDEKQLLDADAAYEEFMRQQGMPSSPSSSPTQLSPDLILPADKKTSGKATDSMLQTSGTPSTVLDRPSLSSVALPIPDVRITQHFTADEIEDEYLTDYAQEIEEIISHEASILTYSEASESAASVLPSDASSLTSSTSSVYTTGSSSPVAGPDGMTLSYAETVDTVSKLSDADRTSSVNQVPITSTKEYSESAVLLPKKAFLAKDTTHLDQISVSLPEVASIMTTSTDTKPRPVVPISVALETVSSIGDKGRQDVIPSKVVRELYEEEQKRAVIKVARTAFTDFVPEEEFTFAAPVSEPTPIMSSYTSTVPTLPSAVSPFPTVASKTFSFVRSSSLDSPVQPSPLPPSRPPPLPPPPPPPPPILPKPALYPKKKPLAKAPLTTAPTIVPSVSSVKSVETTSAIKTNGTLVTRIYTTTPPPVPPKPASIPSGLVFTHRPPEIIKPPIAPKPAIPQMPTIVHKPAEVQPKPVGLSLTSGMSLNLVSPAEYKLTSPTSPLSPHSNKSSPRLSKPTQETYVVITLPSEPGTPTESITSQAIISWPSGSPPKEQVPLNVQPLFIPSISALQIQSTSDQLVPAIPVTARSIFEIVPSSATQLITTEVARTSVSLVKSAGLGGVSITMPPEPAQLVDPSRYRENGRFHLFSDVIDLRTLTKMDFESMDSCMDLSAAPIDVRRQTMASDVSGRPISTVQPAIINLSTASTADPSLAPATETITIVTCTATVSCSSSSESLVDLGHAMTTPLQLTSQHFELGSRAASSQALSAGRDEVPINLSLGTPGTWASTKLVTVPPVGVTSDWADVGTAHEPMESEVVDLSTTKSHRTMVSVDEMTSGTVTTVIEDDEKPVDLTAGRRAVCCDVIYKLPFSRSCTAQAPATTLPEDRFGYRDDHYQYDRSGPYGYRTIGGMKPSMSDTNLSEAGLFLYKSKNTFDYQAGETDVAVDLTSGRVMTGEIVDYSSKITGPYPETRQVVSGMGISAPQYSQARIVPTVGSPYGIGSVLRSSNGVVYSSVATPIPSTYAITTQPGSIFSTSIRDLSALPTADKMPSLSTLQQNQASSKSYSFLTTMSSDKEGKVTDIDIEPGLHPHPLETIMNEPTNLLPVFTTASEAFMDVIQDEDTLLIAPQEGKQQHLDLERELLELEKLKQQRFAEELEWERQEIQRFREQEQFMVQKKLEELQSMKHHLLFQQEEERQAQFMMRQETLAQQQLHIEQIQQLQQQLHQHLEEQKIHQIYQYNYDPSRTVSPPATTDQVIIEDQYAAAVNSQFWTGEETTSTTSAVLGIEIPQSRAWYTIQSDGVTQYIPRSGILSSVSDMSLKDIDVREEKQLKKRSSMPKLLGPYEELDETMEEEPRCLKKIAESGVQTDDEDSADTNYTDQRQRTKKGVDTSVQTDDEDQDEWDSTSRSRRKTHGGKYEITTEVDKPKPFSKFSSTAVQTVAEISVQTEPVGMIKTPSIRAQLDAKVEIIKHISAPEKTYKGRSLGCQTETDSDSQSPQYLIATSPQKDKKRPTPLEIGYSTHLRPEPTLQVAPSPPKSPKVLYSPISPVSPAAVIESAFVPYEKPISEDISPQKIVHADVTKSTQLSPKSAKGMQRSLSDPKPLSPTAEDPSRDHFQYSDGFLNKGSSSAASAGMQKKVKRTLPNPPPEDIAAGTQSAFTTAGSMTRRRICRSNTMARAKILQDIDRELDLVERESAKLRKKQAELDEEEKEIDAKLRYLEMGINRRKEALLKEREKRERDYLQGVAEERDYMSDSEVSSTRPARIEAQHGLERPRTAPQTEFDQFIPAQSQPETQFATPTSPYTQYKYSSPALPTQASIQYTQQSHYQQQQTLYQPPQASPYQTQSAFQTVATMSFSPQAQPPPTQQPSYQLSSQLVVIPQKTRQTSLYLEPKITTNYDVIRNQPLMIAPSSSDNTYAVSHLGSKYSTLDLRMGLDERSSIASSPISSISGDSFYADIDHHTPRNYVLIDDIGDLTKGTSSLSSAYGLHEKDLTKTDRLLRTTEARRVQDVSDFLPPLQTSSRLHNYMKTDEDPMEDPYELKLLKHQIKQEFRRGAESLDHVAGLSQYYHGDTSYRHFPKSEKYSISRLTLEKQAAKQLPAALLYQKQSKHKKALIDPKLSKFSPIQESRDLELDYSTYLTSSTSSLGGITSRARLLQDDVTFGLRKNIADQQKFMGPTLVHSLGTSLGAALSTTMRSTLQDDVDKPYGSGSRSRPSSRPSSIYGIDLSLKRDSSSSSLRLKTQEAEPLDIPFSHAAPSGRTKPTSLPISQSRGRIPIVAQNSEEESPLSPVGQPMGMARAAAGPLPPISADTRDQFGSSHSLPEVQQHMREESRARGYDRDIAFIMDDFQHAMSDSEAYHLRREETDWFDKPRESHLENGHGFDRRLPDKLAHSRPPSQHQDQINGKPIQYIFPHARLKLLRDPKDRSVSGNGLGIRVVGGKEIPGANGEIGAYIAKIMPGGSAEQTGKVMEGMQVLEWNGIPLTAKTYEEVQSIISQQSGEAEICVRLDLNMLSDAENPQHLELLDPGKTVEKTKSPGVDPKQLAAELQKVSLQQAPLVVSSAMDKGSCAHSGTTSATSSSVPSPGQPGSPSVSKKRHSGKQPAETVKSSSHPVTGEIQLQINYDKHLGNLIIHVLQARNLAPRDNNGYSDPFVKVYLLPGRGQVMVVQNASVENKRRTKYIQKTLNPEWNQTVIYKNISTEQLKKKTLEVTVWDYDRFSSNDLLGEVLIELSSTSQLDNTPRWYPLKEQSEGIDHGKSHSGQNSQQSPKPSVIKSRSHGIFPDPSKDMPVPTIEKSHSSPGSSKSSSEGHLRSHGPSRSQSKTSVTQTHLEDAGAAIAAAEAAVQQLRLQPTHKSGQSNNARKQHRHSIAGVLPIQRTQSDNLPPPASDNKDQSQLALRKVMSDGPAKPEGAKPTNHRQGESSVSAGSSASSFGSGYSVDSEGSSSASITGDSNLFPIPRIGKMNQNGQETAKPSGVGLTETEGKTQMVGEIKIALKKEMKTDGEQLIVEILQCRNITYKFKSPDHLPDLYVKLYVVNLATQKRVMKKKTRVCRHDREPSFNETFRFSLNPSGHSLQILLVSNGGKFMKKTLIGEAYIWLDKVDLRKRTVNWHKLLVSSTQAH